MKSLRPIRLVRRDTQGRDALRRLAASVAVVGDSAITAWLGARGVSVVHVHDPAALDPRQTPVAVIAEHSVQPGSRQNQDLRAFVMAGGRALVLEQDYSLFPGVAMARQPIEMARVRDALHPAHGRHRRRRPALLRRRPVRPAFVRRLGDGHALRQAARGEPGAAAGRFERRRLRHGRAELGPGDRSADRIGRAHRLATAADRQTGRVAGRRALPAQRAAVPGGLRSRPRPQKSVETAAGLARPGRPERRHHADGRASPAGARGGGIGLAHRGGAHRRGVESGGCVARLLGAGGRPADRAIRAGACDVPVDRPSIRRRKRSRISWRGSATRTPAGWRTGPTPRPIAKSASSIGCCGSTARSSTCRTRRDPAWTCCTATTTRRSGSACRG